MHLIRIKHGILKVFPERSNSFFGVDKWYSDASITHHISINRLISEVREADYRDTRVYEL